MGLLKAREIREKTDGGGCLSSAVHGSIQSSEIE